LFLRSCRTKQWPEKFNEFSHAALACEDQAEHRKPRRQGRFGPPCMVEDGTG
jgi:hypothetical protein